MIGKLFIRAFGAGLGLTMLSQPASAQTYRGAVSIARNAPNLVEVAPDVKIYPGESVTVSASGSANVNQHNYEKRRCKYAGLKCWYEKRSDTNIQPAKDFEIEVALVDASGATISNKTIDDGEDIFLTVPMSSRFDRGASLHASIKTVGRSAINRASCGNRPAYCSSGDLNLVISRLEAAPRLNEIRRQFAAFAAGVVPADRIRRRDYIDELLIDNEERRREIQTIIAENIQTWVPQAPKSAQGPLIDLIQYALALGNHHANVTILNRARMDSYAKVGQYEELEHYAREEINRLNERCETHCDITEARTIAAALKSLATAQSEKRARNVEGDIALAVATLNRGIDILEKALENQQLASIGGHVIELSNLYQDASNMLNLVRTPAEITKAVAFMEQSVCLHQLGLVAESQVGEVFRAAQCRSA